MDRAKEFKRILDMWSQRDLSVIGKITILKSLAFSKVIYQCGILPIPENFANYISNIAYNFLWNNKPHKVKMKTVIADYEDGGLRMLDVHSFLNAQKAMWVKRLLSPENASWKAIPNIYLQELLGSDTFKCNMQCNTKPKDLPDFYWQVLKSWFEVKKLTNKDDNVFNLRRETLWLNENIKINNEELNWKGWQEKGINIIHEIVDFQGNFLTLEQLNQRFNVKCDTLCYNSLKNSIPIKWRQLLKTMNVTEKTINFDEQIHLKFGSTVNPLNKIENKDIYWLLIKQIQINPIIINNNIEEELGITENDWKNVFTIPKVVRSTKIRAFQYKVLYNLIPCNLYLFRIKKSNSDKCINCQKLDDLYHYLYGCEHVQPFWYSFERWWKQITNEDIQIRKQELIIGVLGNNSKNELLNTCILMAKWHVYKNKLDESSIFFYKFVCELKYYIKVEKTIALNNNTLKVYEQKWEIIEREIT
jgi:hypothetical protein